MLKNKDGSNYRLERPNPLMESQETWGDGYVLHNFQWEQQSLDHQEPKVSPPLAAVVAPPEPVPVVTTRLIDEEDEDKIDVWCLPAQVKEYVDSLYGDKYHKLRYGKKFMFEAMLIDEQDLYIEIWTNTKAVTLKSVLYPKNKSKRWWRVDSVTPDVDGYRITASISDFTPEFAS